ncbi:unnamed protein product [marine sediment metagenome]|uniref:Uncharacterized protein n=1 Tax=marine sediment metagenome TaxID=412755 RepID=X1UJI0_9ZZZZ
MKIIYTKSDHGYKFKHIDYCCTEMKGLLEFDLSHDLFGLYFTGFKKTFTLNYCPFCGEKIKVVERSR